MKRKIENVFWYRDINNTLDILEALIFLVINPVFKIDRSYKLGGQKWKIKRERKTEKNIEYFNLILTAYKNIRIPWVVIG